MVRLRLRLRAPTFAKGYGGQAEHEHERKIIVKRSKSDFDLFLEEHLKDPVFAEKFEAAGDAWDLAIQMIALREKAGLTQAQLARKVGTTQQQISRLEGAGCEGHSLSMLRRIAKALDARVRVSFEPLKAARNPIRPAQRPSTRKPRPKAA